MPFRARRGARRHGAHRASPANARRARATGGRRPAVFRRSGSVPARDDPGGVPSAPPGLGRRPGVRGCDAARRDVGPSGTGAAPNRSPPPRIWACRPGRLAMENARMGRVAIDSAFGSTPGGRGAAGHAGSGAERWPDRPGILREAALRAIRALARNGDRPRRASSRPGWRWRWRWRMARGAGTTGPERP